MGNVPLAAQRASPEAVVGLPTLVVCLAVAPARWQPPLGKKLKYVHSATLAQRAWHAAGLAATERPVQSKIANLRLLLFYYFVAEYTYFKYFC